MKQLTVSLMVAAFLTGTACYAEDGSIQNTKEYAQSARPESKNVVDARKTTRGSDVKKSGSAVAVRKHRDWYYVRAARSAWWPNAPGD
jgi:hypothetical protein